jgi:hypothetical protein
MEAPVPEPDPVALARMKYEFENYDKPGMTSHFWGIFRKSPDMSAAAKSGTPSMAAMRPGIPLSVPAAAGGPGAVTADVSVSTVGDSSALDTKPDARMSAPAPAPDQQPGQASGQAEPKKKDQKKKK